MNVTELVELWTQGDTATDFFRKQVLLVLGERNVAKDSFIQFLAQNDSGHLLNNTFSLFKPIPIPIKVHTVSSNVTICDFDSFDDSAEGVGLPLGISPAYFLKKVISSANELQIIVLINFSSTKNGIDKHHFTAQIRKIDFWLRNIDNYTNSIGLIITNVANAAENQVLVDSNQILNQIESFLEQLRKENSQNLPMLKLLNILVKKTKGTDYERIGIFRQTNNQNSSNQMAVIQNEWLKIKTLLNDMKFSPANINDFNFFMQLDTISSARMLTSGVAAELDERIARKINDIFQKLQNEFEKDLRNNYAEADMKLQKMNSVQITQTTNRNIREVLLDLESKLRNLNIHLSQSFLEETFRFDNYLQFLFSVDKNLKLHEWQKAMAKITDYITSFHMWNNFLREMDFVTKSYAVQKNAEKLYNTFINQPITELNDERLQKFVKDYYHQSRLLTHYNVIVGQKFSSLKILTLEIIFKSNLKPGFVYENNNSTGVTNIFAEHLILSDIISRFPNEKFLSLNAASKIFIDTNITRSYEERPFQMVSMIAPVWELMQNSGIVLDGKKGYTSIIPSGTGHYPGGNGDHGRAGHPGKSAGHFLGVADLFVHNSYNLLISANGGKGGVGTRGGKGSDGKDGDTAVTNKCERKDDFDSYQREELGGVLFHDYCVYGRQGGDGGQGGNGGVGAAGGFAGDLTLIGFEKETNIQTSGIEGQRGEDGKGGAGGEAGKNGKSFKITRKVFVWGPPQCNKESNDFCGARSTISKGKNGASGRDAYVRDTLQNPVKFEHPHWSSLLSTYRKYLLKDVQAGRLSEKKLKFLDKLNSNPSIMDLDLATTLADEFFYLDTQYKMAKNLAWVPHFEKLLYRTERYLTTQHLSNDTEIAKMVQAAILAKLISIKNQRSRTFIVNLKSYLELINDQIKNYDSKSRASCMRGEVSSHQSALKSFASVRDADGHSVIDNNAADLAELISTTQTDMFAIFNESYEQVEHKFAILRTLITMQDIFQFLHFIEEKAKKILDSTLPVNKYFFSETDIPASITAEIKNSILNLTQIKLDNWRKRFEPVLKDLVDNSTASSALNSQFKQNYNSLLETKIENFYKNSKNMREFAKKISFPTADLKVEEKNLIEKFEKTWFLCESLFEKCHLLDNHRIVVNAFEVINKSFLLSKVQQFSDNIMEISVSFFSAVLENPQCMVLGNSSLTNSLVQIQIQFQRLKQSFKLPLPELVEHSFDALHADTLRMECFYKDLSYYHEIKRFAEFNNSHSLTPILSDLDNSISLSVLQFIYQNSVAIPFYQLDFPFAYEDAAHVDIIADNYHIFKKKASTAIDKITSMIERGPIIAQVASDKKVDLGHSQFVEVYRWKGEEHEKTIENLLKGKPVTVKADILKHDSYKQAIRIRHVNLELETKNQTLQKELDTDLRNFGVTFLHSGLSYYKCRDSIFTITHTPLAIYHSFAKYSDTKRAIENMVCAKLKDSDYLLSPFTVWRLSMSHRDYEDKTSRFKTFEKYQNSIDIVLKAASIYLMDTGAGKLPFLPNSEGDYCNSKAMRKYYENDDIVFQMNSTSDFSQELVVQGANPFSRFKREVGHYGGTEIVPKTEIIENRNPNFSSNMDFSNHQIDQYENKIPVLNIAGADTQGGINVCSAFQYNINDCLVLLSLIVQRITDSKPTVSYFQDCAVNYSEVRHCALEIIRKFEESLQTFTKNFNGEEYTFDPVPLMEELEHDIINNGGQNVSEILLNAVSPRKSTVNETFLQRLWNKLVNAF